MQAGADHTDASAAPAQHDEGHQAVIARYGLIGSLGRFRHDLDRTPVPGDKLVVRTERGVELGEVVVNVGAETAYGWIDDAHLDAFVKANGADYPFRRDGKVLRRANPQDVIDHRHLQGSASEEAGFCRKQIEELGLDMKLTSVEHLLGGERIIFNFAAETRVDFRELVRRLAKEYRTRIEMRQVGARDEARLLADYERCGMRCCCRQFMKDLKPVSMRMAKVQKATLDPSKISGRCGRLMCCLRFEDEVYEELRSKLPRRNTWVRSARLIGKVIDSQILTQLVQIELPDQTLALVPNEEILQRDMPQPTEEEVRKFIQQAGAQANSRSFASPEAAPPGAPDQQPTDQPHTQRQPPLPQRQAPEARQGGGQTRPSGPAVGGEQAPGASPSGPPPDDAKPPPPDQKAGSSQPRGQQPDANRPPSPDAAKAKADTPKRRRRRRNRKRPS